MLKNESLDFKIGDEVYCRILGKGTIVNINLGVAFPITVKFFNNVFII